MRIAPTVVILGMAITLSAATTPLLGQGGGGARGGFGGPRVQQMVATAVEHQTELSITDEQMLLLNALSEDAGSVLTPLTDEMQALRQAGNREGMRGMLAQLQEAGVPFVERFEEILSEEQRTALLEYLPRRRRPGGQA